ncbi:MAG TPA: hypothetical protein VFG70_03860 [Gaiellaceae bacterium]|nr:hypothetical protein [Gaiellaceae bacterium]
MRAKAVLATLFVVCVAVSSAVAAPPPGKGKPPTTDQGCKPNVTVVLKGSLAATPGATATSLSVTVKSANRHGRAYATANQPTAVLVDEDTKVRRRGKKTLGDLLAGDRVLVQAKVCKADLAQGATPPLTAKRVVAHPAK